MSKALQFGRSERGNVAILFAFAIPVVFGLFGVAVDYSSAASARANMQQALDVAVLAALDQARAEIGKGVSQSQALTDGAAAGQASFTNNRRGRDSTATATFQLSAAGVNAIAGTASAAGSYRSLFAPFTGRSTVAISTTAKAKASLYVFRQVYLLLDGSASMLIGSTQTDMNTLLNKTGCAFACHDLSGGANADPYYYAKQQGVTLRFDTMKTGVTNLLNYILGDSVLTLTTSVQIQTFESKLNTLAPMAPVTTATKAALPATPEVVVDNSSDATTFNAMISSVVSQVGSGGDGSTILNPQKLVIIATDGVNDPTRDWTWNTPLRDQVRVFDTTFCSTMKSNNVTVGIIDLPYYPMTWDWGYQATLGQPGQYGGATRADDIPIRLKACAGTNYVDGSDPNALESGFVKLFAKTNLLLTQ